MCFIKSVIAGHLSLYKKLFPPSDEGGGHGEAVTEGEKILNHNDF